MTHKITLPDGTIIEFFNDEAKAMWQKASKRNVLKRKHKSARKSTAPIKNKQDGNNARGKYGKANRNHRIFIK